MTRCSGVMQGLEFYFYKGMQLGYPAPHPSLLTTPRSTCLQAAVVSDIANEIPFLLPGSKLES